MTIIKQKSYNFGYIKIKSTLNNIFVTLTDFNGEVILYKTAGLLNFQGSKKRTPYIASQVFKSLMLDIVNLELDFKILILQVYNYIKKSFMYNIMTQIKTLKLNNIIYIQYVNKKIHNGIRLKKKRRI